VTPDTPHRVQDALIAHLVTQAQPLDHLIHAGIVPLGRERRPRRLVRHRHISLAGGNHVPHSETCNPSGKGMLAHMEEKIRTKLQELRGMLQADGGDLEVVEITGANVKVRLKGACGSCPHAVMTLKQGVEQVLRDEVDKKIVVERVE
jgi:Fe-S cluster biogenesis protein NfuA